MSEDEEILRARLPEKGEVLGVIEQMLGGNKVRVRCIDGKLRLCRIPGRVKKRIWFKEGDVVIVVPWSFQDEKGDVIFRYSQAQIEWLKKKGLWQG